MNRIVDRVVLLTVAVFCLGVSDCYTTAYVGYGYGPGYGPGYYNDVFYTPPIDRYGYGYGFYGRP
jgi:hypothetical protein